MIIHHSQTILEQMMQLSARTRYVKPTYDFLLGAYAAMTLVEYAHSIQDVQKSHELMKRAVSEQKQIGPEEPVLSWAADMMRKKSLDVLPVDVPGDGVQNTQEHQRIWVPYDLINSRNSYLSD
jgi:hypothetical protein